MDKKVAALASYFNSIGREFKKNMACDPNSDCNFKDYRIIEFLSSGKKTMSELSEEMNLTAGTMTTAIDNLIEKKLVQRENDENDRRKVLITLSKKGNQIAQMVMNQHFEISEKILKTLNEKEKNEFLQLLEKICSKL